MRHANIETTMKYYVEMEADEVASKLWSEHAPEAKIGADGNNSGNIEQKRGTMQGTPERT